MSSSRPERRRFGPPCGCEVASQHDGCALDRRRVYDALVELLEVLEPREPDPCTGRCRTFGFDDVRWYAQQYGVCPCQVPPAVRS